MNKSKNRVLYSELRVQFKNGKSFTYKRVLRYGFYEDKFEIITRTYDGAFTRILEVANIKNIQEKLKREIKSDKFQDNRTTRRVDFNSLSS